MEESGKFFNYNKYVDYRVDGLYALADVEGDVYWLGFHADLPTYENDAHVRLFGTGVAELSETITTTGAVLDLNSHDLTIAPFTGDEDVADEIPFEMVAADAEFTIADESGAGCDVSIPTGRIVDVYGGLRLLEHVAMHGEVRDTPPDWDPQLNIFGTMIVAENANISTLHYLRATVEEEGYLQIYGTAINEGGCYVYGNLDIEGSFTNSGSLQVYDSGAVINSGTFIAESNSQVWLEDTATFQNDATYTAEEYSSMYLVAEASVLNGGTWTNNGNIAFDQEGESTYFRGTFVNEGEMTNAGDFGFYDNSGEVIIYTIDRAGAFYSPGTYEDLRTDVLLTMIKDDSDNGNVHYLGDIANIGDITGGEESEDGIVYADYSDQTIVLLGKENGGSLGGSYESWISVTASNVTLDVNGRTVTDGYWTLYGGSLNIIDSKAGDKAGANTMGATFNVSFSGEGNTIVGGSLTAEKIHFAPLTYEAISNELGTVTLTKCIIAQPTEVMDGPADMLYAALNNSSVMELEYCTITSDGVDSKWRPDSAIYNAYGDMGPGQLTITGGSIAATAYSAISVSDETVAQINDCVISNSGVVAEGDTSNYVGITSWGELTLSGCEVEGTTGIVAEGGVLEIEDCEITGTGAMVYSNDGMITATTGYGVFVGMDVTDTVVQGSETVITSEHGTAMYIREGEDTGGSRVQLLDGTLISKATVEDATDSETGATIYIYALESYPMVDLDVNDVDPQDSSGCVKLVIGAGADDYWCFVYGDQDYVNIEQNGWEMYETVDSQTGERTLTMIGPFRPLPN